METYKVLITKSADSELSNHTFFLGKVSPQAAQRLIQGFRSAAESLSYMPERCAWLEGEFVPTKTYRTLLFEKRYLLIFRIADDRVVYVEHMVDTRSDYQWLLI